MGRIRGHPINKQNLVEQNMKSTMEDCLPIPTEGIEIDDNLKEVMTHFVGFKAFRKLFMQDRSRSRRYFVLKGFCKITTGKREDKSALLRLIS